MLLSLLKQSFRNQKRAMALMALSVAVGTMVSASLITISLDIKGKVSKELRSFGANITIEPRVEGFADLAGQRRYLREEDIIKSKTIFWRHNILGVAPFLEEGLAVSSGQGAMKADVAGVWFDRALPLPGEKITFKAGISSVAPWWGLEGRAPGEAGNEAVVGVSLASGLGIKEGSTIEIDGRPFIVSGTVMTGGREDDQVFIDLHTMQALIGRPGAISRVQVSALTTPMDEFAYKDPATMSKPEYEKWYCTGYVTSISKQLEEVFDGSRARPIWQVAQSEGTVLDRLSVLVYLLTAAALLASGLGMSTTLAATLLKRLDEIALMKAIGADSIGISLVVLSEAFVIGSAGGTLGYLASLVVSNVIGQRVFDGPLLQRELLLPIALISALGISAIGSLLPIRRALKVKPAVVLKEAR